MNGLVNKKPAAVALPARALTTEVVAVLVSILILAGFLRFMSLDFGLPHRYQIDEPAYVVAALKIGQGNLQINYPPMSPNLQQLAYLLLYGVYFLVQLAVGQVGSVQEFAALYRLDPTPFYLMARGVSVLSSLLTITLLYFIVRRIRDNVTAAIAALFLSVSFLDVRHAHFAEPYSILALLGVLVTYLTLKYFDEGWWKWLILSGFVCGVAVGIRFLLATLAVVPLLAIGYRCFALTPRCRPRMLISRLAVLAGSLLAGVLVGVPGLVINFQNTLSSFRNQAALASGTDGFLGLVFSTLPAWKFYALMLEIAWGIPILLALILGFSRFVWRHEPEETLFAVFPVTYFGVLVNASAASSAFARYLVPVLPFLAYLSADGLVWIVRWGFRGWSLGPRHLFPATATVLLMIIPLMRSIRLDLLWQNTDTRTLALEWIEANIPEGARLAVQWYGPPLSTPEDPEPGARRTYDVTSLYPFSNEPERFSLDYYRNNGYDYIVISSHVYKLSFADEALNKARMDFYLDLLTSARLVAEFKPYDGNKEPAYIFEQMWGPIVSLYDLDRPGPTIKIFALK